MCDGERHCDDGIAAEARFGRRGVPVDHLLIDAFLVEGVGASQERSDRTVDAADRPRHVMAAETHAAVA